MSRLVVPPLDEEPWPTLGPQVVDWLEAFGVYGPGDLSGEPYVVPQLVAAWLDRAYEVYPRGHPRAGRRRFGTGVLSLRKGWSKTEVMSLVAFAESYPDAPVRCVGWDAHGSPVGRGIARDAFIPMVAYTKDQTEELAYGALKAIIGDGPLAAEYDVGEERIIHVASRNKVVPLATNPSSAEGQRSTFLCLDETHRLNERRLVNGYHTMMANLGKRKAADAWAMETTTAFEPGEGSVAELSYDSARRVADGRAEDPRLFYFHMQANPDSDLATKAGYVRALGQASGEAIGHTDVDRLWEDYQATRTDSDYHLRTYLNMVRQSGSQAYDFERWQSLARPDLAVPDGTPIVLTFDGSVSLDSTVLTGMTLEGGHIFEVAAWERPAGWPRAERWTVPQEEVDATVAAAMSRWTVVRMRADPWWWQVQVKGWQRAYGAKLVEEWRTNEHRKMGACCRAMVAELRAGSITHDGASVTTRHVGNARRQKLAQVDDEGEHLWVLTKDHEKSDRKIDGAVTATMAVGLRLDVLAEGWTAAPAEGFAIVLGRGR